MLKDIFFQFKDYLIKILKGILVFYDLFKKEKVFKYFLIIFFLMLISGIIFLFLEYDRVLASYPGKQELSFFEKIITVCYWAIVTISTCGYGDISPGTIAGKTMVIVVLFLGLGSVSLFTANLASALTTKKIMERRGIMDLSEYNEHFVICGWRKDIAKFLSEICLLDKKISYKKIIIIANVDADTIELFRQQYPQYSEVTILRGDFYNETLLKKANVSKALKVLIIADESSHASSTEIDIKTIMAAMTIRSISKNVIISAELLDTQFESNLKAARVDEIIYTNEYGRTLLANSLTKVGVTKIINNLLNVQAPEFITTEKIPECFIGKQYQEIRKYFKEKSNCIVIGLLENVGGYVERKNEAVRKAQQTADIAKLVETFRSAMKIESNLPNINLSDDYIIPENCMAILIGKRG